MPAPVPAGYTRGPIMFLGPLNEPQHSERLLQSFWDEAGSYGARVLVVPTAAADDTVADRFVDWLTEAEVDSVSVLSVPTRRAALDEKLMAMIDNATGILLTDGNPLRFTSLIGGTPLAQGIRRANARGRVVCGVGRAGSILCQHMIAYDNRNDLPGHFLHRSLIQFAPGLGLINRLAIDCEQGDGTHFRAHLSRLLTAVAYNPFLIGVALDPDTGAVVYPDSTLEIFGAGSALLIDGWQVEHTDLPEHAVDAPMSIVGAQMHVLSDGYTYQLDAHAASQPPDTEIPRAGYEAYTSF